MRCRAFTLIELLIVVGIIAILAAIAVPNFLEAHVRAKIARAKAEMKTIATGLESYAVDHNKYAPNYDAGIYGHSPLSEYLSYACLTTPIAYLTSAPSDPFRPDVQQPEREKFYEYVEVHSVMNSITYPQADRDVWSATGMRWLVYCIGPDRREQELGKLMHESITVLYDPTNGTVSAGDIGRSNVGVMPRG
jgi:prepilin-type N-terminal cleavage/methylation domain-containing protein